jgi:CHAT domain-containing protein/Flp pilus assembly protein TadD
LAQSLSPGATLAEHLTGQETLSLRVEAPAGQTLDVTFVEHAGMPGVLSLQDSDGKELAAAVLALRSVPAKTIPLPPGTGRVVLRPANHGDVARVFEIRASAAHVFAAADEARITAERWLGQGELSFSHKTPGYRERALAAYAKSLEIWSRLGDRRREADVLCHMGRVDYQLGDYKTEKERSARAYDLATAENDRSGQAAALYGKAVSGLATDDVKNASVWIEQAVEIQRSLGDVPAEAEAQAVVAFAPFIQGKHEASHQALDAALALAQRSGHRLCEADVRNLLGALESQVGNNEKAIAEYQRALAIDREEEDPVQTAQVLSNLGVVYGKSGDYREAARALEEVLPIRKALSPLSSYANTVFNLAVQREALGEFESALTGYREALEIFHQTKGIRGEGFALNEMGRLELSTGEADQAEDHLKQAAAKWRSIGYRQGEVKSTNALAELALGRGDAIQASRLANSALATARAAGLKRDEEATLHLLARCEIGSGNAGAALDRATEARELAQKLPDRASEAHALNLEGVALRMAGDAAKAREALETALAMDRECESKADEVDDLRELARVDGDAGRVDEALRLTETLGPSTARMESRMKFAARYRGLFDLGIDLRMRKGDAAGAFALSERGRARGLAVLLEEREMDIREGVDAALLSRERDLSRSMDAKQGLLEEVLAGPHTAARESEARATVNRAVKQYEDVEAEIRTRSPRFSALVEPRTLSAEEVQRDLLDSETALVEYWLGAERSYAWLVTKTSVAGFELAGRARIEDVARRAYAALDARNDEREETIEERARRVREADREFENLSAELSGMLLGPVKGLAGVRKIWVVSDGALEYLPFAALPIPGTRTPLVMAHEIVRLPSASILAEMRSEMRGRRRASRGVAIVADPVFRADDERVKAAGARPTAERFNLPRLYFSRMEADAISALGGAGSREIVDFDASRDEVKRQALAGYRVVHFATHALLDSRNPELSGLVLSMIDRSGRPEDGFLRLHEVYNLKLNADLVVLSACRTALGTEVRSEGMIGLTRGFMYAGAAQVMASLWGIQDNSTTWFMTRFYEGLLRRGLPAASALRAAQLDMLKDPRWRAPYYWAAFTVQGGR